MSLMSRLARQARERAVPEHVVDETPVSPRVHEVSSTKLQNASVFLAGDEAVPPDASDYVRTFSGQDLSDVGNAKHFVETFGNSFRYCHPWNRWLVWTGTHWQIDDSGITLRTAKQLTCRMFEMATRLHSKDGQNFAIVSSRLQRIQATLSLAAPDLSISPEDLDADGWLFNTQSGTLDLRTGKLTAHRREDFITKLSPTMFKPEAACAAWETFLTEVFVDAELVSFMQRLLGYCITGDVSEQKLPIFFGTGANGKSTLLNTFLDVIGPDYGMQTLPDFLMQKRDSHPTEKASLFGKRCVAATETESSGKLAESTVKLLTGGEKIMARRMREDFWQFAPTHKLILSTNHRPVIQGTDHGIWRRLVLVPFEQRFEGSRQDSSLPEKLRAEAAGILAWAVRGCMEWQVVGLNPPDAVLAATSAYRSEEDIVGRFVESCCIRSHASTERFKRIYARLEEWCMDTGDIVPSKRAVGQWLANSGFQKFTANGTCYRGLQLKQNEGGGDPWEGAESNDGITE